MGKYANYRKCWQENSRTYETVKSWDKLANGPRNTQKMTPLQWQAQWKFFTRKRDQESCDLSGRCRTTHSQFKRIICFSVGRRIEVVFRFFCCAFVFSIVDKVPTFGVRKKRITVVSHLSHLFRFFIHFTDTDGTVTLTTPRS